MVINTNTQAMAAASNLATSTAMLAKSLGRLSSGSKIVSPADDAAGLAVSSRLDAQVQRLGAARSNVGNAVSYTQTQGGYLKKIAKALDRMSELAILAQDGTKSDPDRTLYQIEFRELQDYILSAQTKEFNGVSLFSAAGLDVTIDSEGGTFTMNGIDLGQATYSAATSTTTVITTNADAQTALGIVKEAINRLSNDRATIGAYQTRLNFTTEQLQISKENLAAASSRIQDVDIAEESTQYARYNILVNAGTAMLAQANALPQSALKLLQ